jgi:sucrose-6-phosphate hydrolase SacC (GH32 family)
MRGGKFPDMPFNGQMTFPSELSITKFNFGYKLIRKPIKEIEKLHGKHTSWKSENIIPGIGENIMKKISGDCYHIIAEFDIKTSDNFGLMVRHGKKDAGTEVLYNVKRGTLSVLGSTVPLQPIDNKIKLELLIDRASIEIYANDGQAVISNCFTPNEKSDGFVLFTNGGELGVVNIDAYKIESVWSQKN